MKMLLKMKPLKEALTALSKVIPNKPNLPILGAVKFSGNKDGLTISATNLDETLTFNLKGEGGGSCILNFKDLKEYTSNCKDTLQLEDVGNKISAIYHAGNIPCIKQFKQHPLSDWLEQPPIRKRAGIPRNTLQNIQKAIPSAAPKSDARSIMKGILLEPSAVVATSGKELIKLHGGITGVKESAVIPNTKFIRSAAFAKSDAYISFEESCTISTDTWQYTFKCIEGNYPNYKQVLPRNNNNTLMLDTEAIEYLTKNIPLLQGDEEHDTVHLFANSKMIKVLPEDLKSPGLHPDGRYNGKSVAVSLNRNLLVRALDLGFTKLCFNDGYSPVMAMKGSDLYVFMPLRNKDADKIKEAAVSGNAEKSAVGKEDNKTAVQSVKHAEETPFKKEERMPQETERTPGFKVVGDAETDPFEELLESINETRNKAKGVVDMSTELGKKVKSAQRAVKAKERDYRKTRDLMERLKKVSGF